jgi:hypothetical protein
MLDWNRFESLTGAKTENFEKLCRGIISRQFGTLGPLKEIKNQPGVEYYIELNQDDSRLANAGQIVGWQCKWFQYRADGQLTANAKRQIQHSLDTTKTHLPELEIWILWTHKTLASIDQTWFYDFKEKYGFELRLWNENDLDQQLSGPAIDLRYSYFGELALTPQMLAYQHEKSVAPVKSRWLHVVHQKLNIEHKARQILGEPAAWENFEKTTHSLTLTSESIKAVIDEPDYQPWHTELTKLITQCETYATYCNLFKKPICGIHLELIKEFVDTASSDSNDSTQRILRMMRRKNLPLSLVITNTLAYIKDTKRLLENAHTLLSKQLIAIVVDAGGGKTQFAAELTSHNNKRSAGILLLGRDLKTGATLDTLAQKISFYTQPVSSFEALVAALDAVGTRAGYRLPIVIDGLNEAQDPREWKSLLESAQPTLQKYSNVVLICTLRTGEHRPNQWSRQHSDSTRSRECFAQQALPDDCYIIESEGFSEESTRTAINAYLHHYKIDADPFMAPLDFFSHPLNLKIFCEVTNRSAQNIVRVAHFPSSIYSLFSEQVLHSAKTIAGMTNLVVRYQPQDIENAIYFLGETLWNEGSRSASEGQFLAVYDINSSEWESNIINLLVQEGLIFRDEITRLDYKITPAYDMLGGYFIAYYLLEKNKNRSLADWMQPKEFLQKLFGAIPDQHELSQDILHALVALTPKYQQGHDVWQVMPSEYSSQVLGLSHLIDACNISDETILAYKNMIIEEKLPKSSIEQLGTLRTAVGHPFNADFFSNILTELSIADRDLSWTEYNRIYCQDIILNVGNRVKYWRNGAFGNEEVERLRVLSISWLLTSSCIELRDVATEALFYYGLHYPENFLAISYRFLTVNDPYVSERLLAASYGVVGTLLPKGNAVDVIAQFARNIFDAMFSENAKAATTHLLAREYASSIILSVNRNRSGLFTDDQIKQSKSPFSLMPRKKWALEKQDEPRSSVESPFRMDFENYTIGSLVRERNDYDYDHPEYKDVRNTILWRITELGWSSEKFADIDKDIESDRGNTRHHRPKVERYGKKYSWIAYYEMAGQLEDDGKLDLWAEKFDADIDPFFPRNTVDTLKETTMFLGDESITTKDWITDHELPNLEHILTTNEAAGHLGPWVLLNGYIAEESNRLDRNYYCLIKAFFIDSSDRVKLQEQIKNKNQIDWPEVPHTSYIYSGELYENSKFSFEENHSIQVTVGYEKQEFEQPQIVINGQVVTEGGAKVIDVPLHKYMGVQISVIEYRWESSSNSKLNMSRVLLAPWIVDALCLTFDATNFSYTDSKGELAAVFVVQKGEDSSNYLELFYLRKDLLISLLKKKDFELISKIKGERRLARIEHFDSYDEDAVVKYKNFEFIQHFLV